MTMPEKLKALPYYRGLLDDLRKKNPYAKTWKLKIERHTNRHVDSNGHSWGWYELFPLEIEIGFWGREYDDLKGFDIADWNRRAGEGGK
jgi:hypothetical protein